MLGTCAKKIVYYDEAEAIKAAKKIRKKGGKKSYPYKCQDCLNYHLSCTDPDTYRIRQIASKVK